MSLFDHLWQSTLFGAFVFLLTLLLRKNSATIRYRLWLAASLKFLLPFSLLAMLGAKTFVHTVLTWTFTNPSPSETGASS